jgi:hypothetical protein
MAETTRPQVNFRVPADLLEAIRAKCAEQGVFVTNFFIDSARAALGMETMNPTTHPNSEAFQSLTARLADVETRLAESLASREQMLRDIDATITERVQQGIELEVEKCLGGLSA